MAYTPTPTLGLASPGTFIVAGFSYSSTYPPPLIPCAESTLTLAVTAVSTGANVIVYSTLSLAVTATSFMPGC